MTPPRSPAGAPAVIHAGAPLSRDEAEHLLREAIGQSDAEQAEAIVESRRESLTRFANNEIHQNVTSFQHALTLRVRVGRRSGTAATNRLDSSGLRQVADRALAIARLSPEDADLPDLAPPAEYRALEAFVPATAASTPEERAQAVGTVMSDAESRGLNAAGALTATAGSIGFANSRGGFAFQPETSAQFTCTVRSETSSGWVDLHRRDVGALAVEALGRAAIEKAERSRDPVAIDSWPAGWASGSPGSARRWWKIRGTRAPSAARSTTRAPRGGAWS